MKMFHYTAHCPPRWGTADAEMKVSELAYCREFYCSHFCLSWFVELRFSDCSSNVKLHVLRTVNLQTFICELSVWFRQMSLRRWYSHCSVAELFQKFVIFVLARVCLGCCVLFVLLFEFNVVSDSFILSKNARKVK